MWNFNVVVDIERVEQAFIPVITDHSSATLYIGQFNAVEDALIASDAGM